MKHSIFDSERFGLTDEETRYLKVRHDRSPFPWVWFILALIGLSVVAFHFSVVAAETPATTAPLKTNADYCLEWARGDWIVIGAAEADVAALCQEYL